MSKSKRLLAIRKIIREKTIKNQEELLNILLKKGFALTQATLSRDLKTLRVARIPDEINGYIYAIPGDRKVGEMVDQDDILVNSFKSISYSENIAVIKTFPGYATGFASEIDRKDIFEILGTVAGDDTIMLVMREGAKRRDLEDAIIMKIPGLKEKIRPNNE